MKALASRRLDGRTIYVVEGDVKKGDMVLIEAEDGARAAKVISQDTLSIAVSTGGDERGLIGQ